MTGTADCDRNGHAATDAHTDDHPDRHPADRDPDADVHGQPGPLPALSPADGARDDDLPARTVITEPGFYAIGSGVVDSNLSVWLEIRVSNVTLDGMGHTIDGVDGFNTHGIRVRGEDPIDNITIQNVTVTDFAYRHQLLQRHQRPYQPRQRLVEHLRRDHGRGRRRQRDRVQHHPPGRRRHQPDRDETDGRSQQHRDRERSRFRDRPLAWVRRGHAPQQLPRPERRRHRDRGRRELHDPDQPHLLEPVLSA